MEIGGDGATLELRCVEGIDTHVGFVESFARMYRNGIDEVAALVLPSGSLAAPVGEGIVAGDPDQGLVPGNDREVPRNDLEIKKRLTLRVAAHLAQLWVDRCSCRRSHPKTRIELRGIGGFIAVEVN